MDVKDQVGVAMAIVSFLLYVPAWNQYWEARQHRVPDSPPDPIVIAPLYPLFRPELFTEEGNRHRVAALRGLLRATLCFLVPMPFAAL